MRDAIAPDSFSRLKTPIHNPPNKLHIDEIFMFISVDDDGNEGVCAFQTASGMMPMIGADLDRIESLRPIAKQLAGIQEYTGKKIRLVKFKVREEMEIIEP